MSTFPTNPVPTHSLVVADLVSEPMDGQIAVCGLQGIVNRYRTEKLYVHHTFCADNRGGWNDPEERGLHMAHTAIQWLDAVYADMPRETLSPAEHLTHPMFFAVLKKYIGLVRGAVIYDPDLEQATIELATTIAGQKDYVIVSPALYEMAIQEGYGFPEVEDLRRYSFADNMSCLAYALDNWFDGAEHKVAYTWSHMTTDSESWGPAGKDYVVSNRLFTFFLDIFDPEERKHYADVFDRYPKGTPILGWTDEIVADGLFAGMGRMMVPFISVENLSVSSSFPAADISPRPCDCREPEADATYIIYQVADGDNLEHSMVYEPYTIARDPAYGSIPAGWVINPALSELAPRHLAYLTETLRNAGQEPVAMFSDGSPAPDRYTGFAGYCRTVRRLMKRSGITCMKQMADSEAVAWNVQPAALLSGYAGKDPRGIGPYEYHMDGETFHLGTVPMGECDIVSIIRQAKKPFFLSIFAGTAMDTVASRIRENAEKLLETLPDEKLRFVTPSEAAALYRKVRRADEAPV